jgi:hypothetical protein
LVIDEFVIRARTTDGYVDATNLCKAGGKRFHNWYQLQSTKEFIEALEQDLGIIPVTQNFDGTGMPVTSLVDIKRGKSSQFAQGSWIHPDLAGQLAQWISPIFAIRVSRWIRDIVITGKAELKNEKTNDELIRLQLDNQKKDGQIQQQNEKIQRLETTHKRLLKKREYHKFEKGPCFYIVQGSDNDRFKVGFDGVDINARLQTYRTSIANMKLRFLLYTHDAHWVEQGILSRFDYKKVENNHEFIEEVTLEELINSVNTLVRFCNMKYTVVSDENIALYNQS